LCLGHPARNKIQEIGRELGVRYVLEGSFQKFGDQIRITAQLVDAANGHHLWAEKYDRELKDIFSMRDEITIKITNALQVKLTDGESANWGPETESFEAYIKMMQSLEHFRAFTPDDNILSRQKAQEALDLDPNYSSANAMRLNPIPPSWYLENLGSAYRLTGQYEKAVHEYKNAIQLQPEDSYFTAYITQVMICQKKK
jgi:adenylate cyclase